MKKKTEGGFIALTSVLIIGAVVLVLGISLFHSALTDYSISTAYQSGQEAAFLADFCLKEGMFKLQEDINYIGREDINVNNATCTINFVKQINEGTKEISSLGRAGDQPHFSRSSQKLRYIIESSAEDWNDSFATSNVEIVGDFLRLKRPEEKKINRITDFSDDWNNSFATSNVEVTEDGSLVLAAATPPPSYQCSDGVDNDGDGLIDYPADPGCSSSEDNDEYNEPGPEPVIIILNSKTMKNCATLCQEQGTSYHCTSVGTNSDAATNGNAQTVIFDLWAGFYCSSIGVNCDSTMSDSSLLVSDCSGHPPDWTYCKCELSGGPGLKGNGESCGSDVECQSGNCYIDEDGDRYAPSSGTQKCQANSQISGTDCYDVANNPNSANAHPGQTTCFSTDRGDGSYDYNCANGNEVCQACATADCLVSTYGCGAGEVTCYTWDLWAGCLPSGTLTVKCK